MSGAVRVHRIVMAIAVAAVFSGLAWADATGFAGAAPAWWLLPVVVAIAIGGCDELVRLCGARDLFLPTWLLRPTVVAVPLAGAVGAQAFSAATATAAPPVALGWAAAAFSLAVLLFFAVEVAGYRAHGRTVERIAAATLIVAYLGLPLAFMVGLRLFCVENLGAEQRGAGHLGILPLVSLVASVKAADVAAYVVGSLVGRHRMAPVLSPGKTWEGAAAAVAGSLAASWFTIERFAPAATARPWGGWATFGLCVGLAGMLGDMAESLLKREAGVKDSGRSLGGLGGVLDLVDSLLIAAPVAWVLWAAGR